MSVVRAFIAVDLSPEVLGRLEYLSGQLKGRMPGSAVRWVPARNIHLTLKFLGDVSVSNLDMLYKVLEVEASKIPEFEIRVAGLGAFPSTNRPRVIWVGIEAPAELSVLQRGIESETSRLGYTGEERGYSPHLTLGRVLRNVTAPELRQVSDALVEAKVGLLGVSLIKGVYLYRSELNPQGSIYTKLYSGELRRN
jgi:2'-5' RNA ligase